MHENSASTNYITKTVVNEKEMIFFSEITPGMLSHSFPSIFSEIIVVSSVIISEMLEKSYLPAKESFKYSCKNFSSYFSKECFTNSTMIPPENLLVICLNHL